MCRTFINSNTYNLINDLAHKVWATLHWPTEKQSVTIDGSGDTSVWGTSDDDGTLFVNTGSRGATEEIHQLKTPKVILPIDDWDQLNATVDVLIEVLTRYYKNKGQNLLRNVYYKVTRLGFLTKKFGEKQTIPLSHHCAAKLRYPDDINLSSRITMSRGGDMIDAYFHTESHYARVNYSGDSLVEFASDRVGSNGYTRQVDAKDDTFDEQSIEMLEHLSLRVDVMCAYYEYKDAERKLGKECTPPKKDSVQRLQEECYELFTKFIQSDQFKIAVNREAGIVVYAREPRKEVICIYPKEGESGNTVFINYHQGWSNHVSISMTDEDRVYCALSIVNDYLRSLVS